MLILRSKTRRDVPPATPSMAAALPFAVLLPALSVVFGDRLGTPATVALILAGLAVIACTAAQAGRAAVRAEQARRDEAVLDALEPLAGLRRR
ncbi:hypothetical protein ACFCYM_33195 [Streptomyces sp. NPDC056254]|uniref:hypothetical protein n=1 Tax=unclassified Streptomyces TaxID=2593676 RepID=UPI0005ECE955|nr:MULTISPECIES: hypothetical protein [unclassified Streptomyces]APU41018.1 hypothetical protein BSL84_15905 [Streptomyces sp. TN58]KJK43633.1 hypothetical protein UK14_29960 [Streptomyces sp. NRRL F-4428]